MRRILIILCLLAVCAAVSTVSIRKVESANAAVTAAVVRSLSALEAGDEALLAREISALTAYWEEAEITLVHFVRHTGVDDITRNVARLHALAAGKDYPELAATLESIRAQIKHISQSEQVALSNLV